MEAPIAGGHPGALPIQGQGGRREWRKVTDPANGRERIGSDHGRANPASRPRSGHIGQRRSSRNGRIFHPGSSEHSSDSDNHGGDGSGGHMMGGPVSPQELINQSIGHEDEAALYDEIHRVQQQNEHASMSTMSMESGLAAMENANDALEQRLHEISRQREQLQQAELELRAQFIARSEVHRLQSSFDDQSKQHSDVVSNLQNQLRDRDQQIHHLEQNLEEREQQLRENQMQTDQQVWEKDTLLRDQTNELTALRRERESTIAEHKAAAAQLDAERSDFVAQLEHLKEQVHEKDRHMQEVEEQNRTTQDMMLFKDSQLQDAQAWMARAQELDAYHVNANNTLHAELRDRSDQLNQLWMGYQRQLADMERFHAQVVQRLQVELNEAREQTRLPKGTSTERLESRDDRQIHAANNMDLLQHEGSEDTGVLGSKAALTNSGVVVRGNPVLLSHGNMESAMPVFIPRESSAKGEQATGHPIVPAPLVVGIGPVMASSGAMPVMHQFSLQQQAVTPTSQQPPVTVHPTSLMQLQALPSVLPPPQHLAPIHQQVHHQQNSRQQQLSHGPHHSLSSSSLPTHNMQPSQQHLVQVLEHEAGQQQGGLLLSQLSSQKHVPMSSVQSSVQKGQQQATGSEPVQPLHEDQQVQLPSHGSQDQKQVEQTIQHHHQPSTQQEGQNWQRLDQQQHSQSHKLLMQQHDEALQLQHQQGISSTMHHLSQPPASVTDESQHQLEPSITKSLSDKQEPRNSVATSVTSQVTTPEAIKSAEPVLLDERSLVGCLVRAVPAEASAKIRISSTLPNRLGKMLAPLHWHDYRKQYGRLDEFVTSHSELFVIEGDYIHLREGAHAMVSATTAVAKAAAAAAAAGPAGPAARVPTVAVTPVAQVSQMQRGRNARTSNPDEKFRSQSQKEDVSVHKQRPVSPQRPKSGNSRQNSGSFMVRNSGGNGMSLTSTNGSKQDGQTNLTGGDYGSNGLLSSSNSSAFDNGDATSYGNSGRTVGYRGNRQQGSRNSLSGSGHYRKQENHLRSQPQESRPSPTPPQ